MSNPVAVGPYFVTYSEVSMAFACLQVLLGIYILWRSMMVSVLVAVP